MSKYDMKMETDIKTIPGKLISHIKTGSTILEFGAATGRMTEYLSQTMKCNMYIVEIDEEAYKKALHWAEDGLCGDITELTWLSKFGEMKFDYILFMDVLEHLPDPESILMLATNKLLKEDGAIITSLPNIGHADIIYNLYNNKFKYTQIGLLDNTHIHFWGYEDLEDAFYRCGLGIEVEDAVYTPPSQTEQSVDYRDIPCELRTLIESRVMTTVYQFFFVLKKVDYIKEKGIHKASLIERYQAHQAIATCYFDCGIGYTEENSRAVYPVEVIDSNTVKYVLDEFPDNCKRLRFDPSEQVDIIIEDLQIYDDQKIYEFKVLNGFSQDNVILFNTQDPQIEIQIDEAVEAVNIKFSYRKYQDTLLEKIIEDIIKVKGIEEDYANLKLINNDMLEKQKDLQEKQKDLQDKLQVMHDKNKYNEELLKEMNKKNKKYMDEIHSMSQTKAMLETRQKELEYLVNDYQQHTQNLLQEIQRINMEYSAVINSECWKMTKPIRVIMDKVRSTHVGDLTHKALSDIKNSGIKYTARKIKNYLKKEKVQQPIVQHIEGIDETIDNFSQYVAFFNQNIKNDYNTIYNTEQLIKYDNIDRTNEESGKIVLMVSHELHLTGAPVALYYFAKSLKDNGHYPVIICPADGKLTSDIIQDDIPVIVYQALFHDNFIKHTPMLFDYVVANTLVSYPIIQALADKDIPVIWWIHEAIASYSEELIAQLPQTIASNIHIYCGGSYAKRILGQYRSNYKSEELLYYVPEINKMSQISYEVEVDKNKIIFAIIGTQEDRKGQDVLVDAIGKLSDVDRDKACFVFIGKKCSQNIYNHIQIALKSYPNSIKYIEELQQDYLRAFYNKMNCLICASKDDPMPIVVTEAMMLSKDIICSEHTGSATILTEMKAGFVYQNNSSDQLAQYISQVINRQDDLIEQRKNARFAYEKYFSKQVFDMNVESVISDLNKKQIVIEKPLLPKSTSCRLFIERWQQEYMREGDGFVGEDALEVYAQRKTGRKILLISHELSLTGGPIALQHMAQTMYEQGDCPIIISPSDGKMKEEFLKIGIPVIVYSEVYSTDFLTKYDYMVDLVVMNTVVSFWAIYPLINSVVPIMWWIHDSHESYDIGGFKECLPSELPQNLRILCGGQYAKDALLKNYPDYKADILLYDTIDIAETIKGMEPRAILGNTDKYVFTVIGMQNDRKGHDVLCEAIDLLEQEVFKNCMFVFIGKRYSELIWDKIEYICNKYPESTKYIEEVSREELVHVYDQSDCIICSSKDDPMPIFVTEAMSMSKAIICSENTGSAAIIREMNAGFVYENNSPHELAKYIEFVYTNKHHLDEVCTQARKAYEKYFSKEVFEANTNQLLDEMLVPKSERRFDGIVSVVIPTFNAGIEFEQLITLLQSQELVNKIQVTIVDSGSSDQTVAIAKRKGVNLIEIKSEVFSHSYARNLGAENSIGDIVIFMTQDAMPSSKFWISNIIQPLIKEGIAAVSCTEFCTDEIELYYKISSWGHKSYTGVLNGDIISSYQPGQSIDELRRSASLNDVTCVVNKEIFDQFKYRYNYAEDLDLGVRLLKSGYKIKLITSEQVIHGHNRAAGYYLKRTIVEDEALNKILHKVPYKQDVSIVAKRVVIGYKGVTTLIQNMRENMHTMVTVPIFYEEITKQLDILFQQDIFNLEIKQVAYSDSLIEDTITKAVEFATSEQFDQMNDILHMLKAYIMNIMKQYLEIHHAELDSGMQESIYDCLFKQTAVFIGLDMANIEQPHGLQEQMDLLTKGV